MSESETVTAASEPRNRSGLQALLFPEKERAFPGERWVRSLLRTAHIASIAVLIGGHYFGVEKERLYGPLAWVLGTGALFVALESYGTLGWLFQIRGLATLLKLLLILLVPVYWEHRIYLLMTVLIIGSVSSHMPGKVRYYSVLDKKEGEYKKG